MSSDWVTEETKHKSFSDIKGLKPCIVNHLKSLGMYLLSSHTVAINKFIY